MSFKHLVIWFGFVVEDFGACFALVREHSLEHLGHSLALVAFGILVVEDRAPGFGIEGSYVEASKHLG